MNFFNESSLTQLVHFFEKTKTNKLLQDNVSESLIADHIMALVMNQALQWKTKKDLEKVDVSIQEQREVWVESTVSLLFHDALSR